MKKATYQFKFGDYWLTISDDGIEVYSPDQDRSGGASWNVIVERYAPKIKKKGRGK